jgi:hypothetical protein
VGAAQALDELTRVGCRDAEHFPVVREAFQLGGRVERRLDLRRVHAVAEQVGGVDGHEAAGHVGDRRLGRGVGVVDGVVVNGHRSRPPINQERFEGAFFGKRNAGARRFQLRVRTS